MCLSLTELPLQIGRCVQGLDVKSHFYTFTFVFCSNVDSAVALLDYACRDGMFLHCFPGSICFNLA
ncbi:hypothetical protein RchiOBHm_Chr6g0253881 [Rosa chinensis]|uniref:Uncharacterized protein n=1 Tax=Rosa chinensis TaxID=74649 RepID=A0A2P6PLH6_ROSCH|nr:hypothetical protein RchiOBHm_Chr6g0253881 [Rosa chinensis]